MFQVRMICGEGDTKRVESSDNPERRSWFLISFHLSLFYSLNTEHHIMSIKINDKTLNPPSTFQPFMGDM